jgi:hypothetical protein
MTAAVLALAFGCGSAPPPVVTGEPSVPIPEAEPAPAAPGETEPAPAPAAEDAAASEEQPAAAPEPEAVAPAPEAAAPAAPEDPKMAAFRQKLEVASMTADGLEVRSLRCGLDGGGFFAAMGLVGALAQQRKDFDKCAPAGGAARLVFDFSDGKVTDVESAAAEPGKAGACAAKAMKKAKIPFTGRCSAVILFGKPASAQAAAATLGE